jgi:hypothetical protein
LGQRALDQPHTQLNEQMPRLAPNMVHLPPEPAISYLAFLAQQATGLGIA